MENAPRTRVVSAVKPFARRVATRVLPHLYRGDAVECPCCGGRFRAFMRHNGRPARCPACLALERHRALWLYLRDDIPPGTRILHFAPELALLRALSGRGDLDYVTADLDPSSLATVRADITAIPFEDESFDLVLCNHVLEHIEADTQAMSELRRVLRPDGRLVMQHPVDENRATSYEDPSIRTPAERREAFNQRDHVRIYGRDYYTRLESVGLDVEVVRLQDRVDAASARRFGLGNDPIAVCRRSAARRAAEPSAA